MSPQHWNQCLDSAPQISPALTFLSGCPLNFMQALPSQQHCLVLCSLIHMKIEQLGGMEEEVGVSSCKLLYTEWMINKVLLYGTKNYIQQPMINHNGEEFLRKNAYIDIYIYETRAESLCSISIINTTL